MAGRLPEGVLQEQAPHLISRTVSPRSQSAGMADSWGGVGSVLRTTTQHCTNSMSLAVGNMAAMSLDSGCEDGVARAYPDELLQKARCLFHPRFQGSQVTRPVEAVLTDFRASKGSTKTPKSTQALSSLRICRSSCSASSASLRSSFMFSTPLSAMQKSTNCQGTHSGVSSKLPLPAVSSSATEIAMLSPLLKATTLALGDSALTHTAAPSAPF